MLFIAAALYIEARPLIAYYNLKKDNASRYYQIFRNEDIVLVITGTGKVNSAVGVSHMLSRYPFTEQDAVINWGICGTGCGDGKPGTPYLVHKIIDHETGRSYYPDMLLVHPFAEADLETFSSPVTADRSLAALLCDMEASGFYQAAAKYFSPHNIHVIKIVSDRLEGERLEQDFVLALLHSNVTVFDEFVQNVKAASDQKREILSQEEYRSIQQIMKALRLSESQRHRLVKACTRYKIRTDKTLDFLKQYEYVRVQTKNEGKEHLQKIIRQLSE
ncbi:MAG: nucleoside phosphorylase [Firmicutes bacterium]|nr:nucleoside phosphorylase [Bacillota bacterium]